MKFDLHLNYNFGLELRILEEVFHKSESVAVVQLYPDYFGKTFDLNGIHYHCHLYVVLVETSSFLVMVIHMDQNIVAYDELREGILQ